MHSRCFKLLHCCSCAHQRKSDRPCKQFQRSRYQRTQKVSNCSRYSVRQPFLSIDNPFSYTLEYIEETEINSQFNTFNTFLKIAYLGPNKVKHQLAKDLLQTTLESTSRSVNRILGEKYVDVENTISDDSWSGVEEVKQVGLKNTGSQKNLQTPTEGKVITRNVLA